MIADVSVHDIFALLATLVLGTSPFTWKPPVDDEHAEVHFGAGAVSYPPWIKKWLRWEFAQSILMMIQSEAPSLMKWMSWDLMLMNMMMMRWLIQSSMSWRTSSGWRTHRSDI